MRGGPAAGLGARGLQAGEFFAHDDQTQVHIVQADAGGAGQQLAFVVVATAHASKGVKLMATKGKHVGGHGLAVAERDALAARDDRELTTRGHKAGDVEVEHTARFHELTVSAIEAERKTVAAVGHRQRGGACAVVHHQGAGGFGRGGDGAAGLHGLQRHRLRSGFVSGHQGHHVGAKQAACKTQLQLAPGVDGQAGCGSGDTGQRCVQRGLYLSLSHVGAQGAGGDGAAAVGQGQGVVDLGLGATNDHALQLAGALFALGQIGGRDHRQTEVARGIGGRAKVGADIGHIGEGQGATKAEGKARFARVGAALSGHRDLARAEQGVHAGLQAGAQLGWVGAVADGWAVAANTAQLDRNLEAAHRQLCIDRNRADRDSGHIRPCQGATEAQQVSIAAIGHDADGAQAAQAGRARLGGAQGGLHLGRAGAKGDVLAQEGLARMAPAQHKSALGVGGAVQAQALNLGHRRCAVAQQGVVELGAGNAYALRVDVHPGQSTHKSDHIALAR